VATKFDVFAQHHKQGTAISPRDGLATLEGARFVCASESDQERRISAAILKSITGGERLRAAKMYEQDRAFDVTFKIWLSTNHEPSITDTSEGMWRRVHRVNFDVIIPPQKRDPQLVPKLIAEGSGILNWCLKGLRQYRAGGLQVPDAISKATAEYRTSQDLVEQFLAERCEIDRKRFTAVDELYREFHWWAHDAGPANECRLVRTGTGQEVQI
jgi:putative DNA primase/helicase